MGKEMFASVLWLPESQEPNWPAAQRKAQEIIWDENTEDSELIRAASNPATTSPRTPAGNNEATRVGNACRAAEPNRRRTSSRSTRPTSVRGSASTR